MPRPPSRAWHGMTGPLRVGIIGANPNRSWAKDSHIPALRSLENLQLAAVATTSRASADAAAAAFGVRGLRRSPRPDHGVRHRHRLGVPPLFASIAVGWFAPLSGLYLPRSHLIPVVGDDGSRDSPQRANGCRNHLTVWGAGVRCGRSALHSKRLCWLGTSTKSSPSVLTCARCPLSGALQSGGGCAQWAVVPPS